jgi:signal transduction histidine kinase
LSIPVGDPDLPPPDPRAPLLRACFEALPDPVLVRDRRGRVLFENRRARELFTLPEGAGEDARRRVEANHLRFSACLAARPREAADANADAVTLHLAEPGTGRERVFHAATAPLAADGAVPEGATVTLLREFGDAGEGRAQEERAGEDRQRSAFFASMSHELRTPVNALLGYAHVLREGIYGPLTDRQDHALKRMESAGAHLLELVDDLMDLARLEAGRLELHLRPVALDTLVAEVTAGARPLARSRGLELLVDVPADLPTLVSDAARLRQVVRNLLSNAVKFTHTGGVSLVARPAGDHAVEIAVADTGIGIAPEEIPRIFDDFRQVDQSSSREFSGTGVGLSLVRKLLGVLGGSLLVESVPGEGSVFTVRLPLRSPVAESAAVHPPLEAEVRIVQGGVDVPLAPAGGDARR